MSKKNYWSIALVLLPLIAVVLAGMPNAVTVYEKTGTDAAVTCSFFTLIEDVSTGVCLPYAGIFGALCFGLAVIYLVRKNAGMLKWILGSAFVSVTLAVVPILAESEVVLLPNMLIPVLMGVEALLAFGVMKSPAAQEKAKPKEQRLH